MRTPNCEIYYPNDDFKDATGCLLPKGHTGTHVCKDPNGDKYEWQTDVYCNCQDCWSDDPIDWCKTYRKL